MMLGFCILLASFLPALAFAIPVAPTVEPEVSGCILVDLGGTSYDLPYRCRMCCNRLLCFVIDFVIKDDGTKVPATTPLPYCNVVSSHDHLWPISFDLAFILQF